MGAAAQRVAAALALLGLAVRSAPVPVPEPDLGHQFEICPGVADHLHITSLEFSPDPIKAESLLHVAAKGTTDEPVSGGQVKLAVSYYGVPVTSKNFNICTFGLKCPAKAGIAFTGKIDYHVPNIPLTGVTLDVQIDIVDEHDKPLSCIKTTAKVAAAEGRLRRLLEHVRRRLSSVTAMGYDASVAVAANADDAVDIGGA